MNRLSFRFSLVALLAALLFMPASSRASRSAPGLLRAPSCDSVRSRLIDILTDQALRRRPYFPYRRYRRYRGHGGMRKSRVGDRLADRPILRAKRAAVPRASAEAVSGRSGGSGGGKGPSHFTGTNNQVVGVDEADQVKTDGKFLYTIAGRDVVILKSWPAPATAIVGRYHEKSGFTPRSLFLRGDQIMVLSHGYRRRYTMRRRPGWWSRSSTQMTRITLLDIRERRRPRRLAAVEIEGRMLQARLIGANAFVVSSDAISLPRSFWRRVWAMPSQAPNDASFRPWGQKRQRPRRIYAYGSYSWNRQSMRRRVRRALAGISIADLLPSIAFHDGNDRLMSARPLHRCTDLYIPQGPARMGILSLTKLAFQGGRVTTAGVLSGGQRVYASRANLYVSTTAYRWQWSRRWSYGGTQIHKFSLGGNPRYQASGVVDGYLLNQFSMDEHRGYLRVATTSRGWGWRSGGRAGNNLFVLGQAGRQLRVVGAVSGLAPGERIYAARMMGDRGYMVTFRRTDPLYTLDLRNPREPKVVGELKVKGYSSYIHPLGRNMLLTVGQDADARGRVRGAHLQIFDVSNLRQPSRTHHYLLTEGFRSSSRAQYDHHAFTFDARSGTLALPLNVSSGNRWTGIILVKVNAHRGFKYLGTVDHRDLALASPSYRRPRCPPNARCRPYFNRRAWIPIKRSVFIDRYVFTLSRLGVEAHDLGQGKPVKVAALRFDQRSLRRKPLAPRPWH